MRIRALDSIRGFLLLQMTLDHFGHPISYYLYQCFGFFSAAEGFFFLSGFVGMLAAKSKSIKDPTQSWMRWRAFKTWRYHAATVLLLSLIGFFLVPGMSTNFKALYQHPISGILWSSLLVNTPAWLDVLPLYVIYLLLGSFVFPLFARAKTKRDVLLLWLPSFLVWLAAQFGLRNTVNSIFPEWIYHGFFDPFAWQCVYFSGAAVATWWKLARTEDVQGSGISIKAIEKLTPLLFVGFIFCFLWAHHIIPLQAPSETFISREHVGILRFANYFTFMLIICWIVRHWQNLLDFRPLNTLGRHSLDVYTSHIVMIYFWFATPKNIRYNLPWNVIIPLSACVALWIIAKIREPHKTIGQKQ